MPNLTQQLLEAVAESQDLLAKLPLLAGELDRFGRALLSCWERRGKVLVAGNGGSAADAMHFAEELVVRFRKNRRALAAIALCDPTVISCAGNDFGYESVFERQIEALGNPGDVFVAFTTSGNSVNLLRALDLAKAQGVTTVTFLGKGGGLAAGRADLELIVPSDNTARIQEAHKLLFHTLCDWIDDQVDEVPLRAAA
jgi:D-sedoheptulose 7-phosphate isomerase